MLTPRSHGATIGVIQAPLLRGREPSVEVEQGSAPGDPSGPGHPQVSNSSGALPWCQQRLLFSWGGWPVGVGLCGSAHAARALQFCLDSLCPVHTPVSAAARFALAWPLCLPFVAGGSLAVCRFYGYLYSGCSPG
jgi:hypothetical protein